MASLPPGHRHSEGERFTRRPKCCWCGARSWGEGPGEPPPRPPVARLDEDQMQNEAGWQGVAAGLTPALSGFWLLAAGVLGAGGRADMPAPQGPEALRLAVPSLRLAGRAPRRVPSQETVLPGARVRGAGPRSGRRRRRALEAGGTGRLTGVGKDGRLCARGAVHVRSSGRGRRRMARCCEGEDRARASTALCVVLRGPRGVGV